MGTVQKRIRKSRQSKNSKKSGQVLRVFPFLFALRQEKSIEARGYQSEVS